MTLAITVQYCVLLHLFSYLKLTSTVGTVEG